MPLADPTGHHWVLTQHQTQAPGARVSNPDPGSLPVQLSVLLSVAQDARLLPRSSIGSASMKPSTGQISRSNTSEPTQEDGCVGNTSIQTGMGIYLAIRVI